MDLDEYFNHLFDRSSVLHNFEFILSSNKFDRAYDLEIYFLYVVCSDLPYWWSLNCKVKEEKKIEMFIENNENTKLKLLYEN